MLFGTSFYPLSLPRMKIPLPSHDNPTSQETPWLYDSLKKNVLRRGLEVLLKCWRRE
uniref:Uncharacterized protein n=1 Tax=Physcomitrium patens TaxID=3218 RepID=A0A2K1KLC5_PHYPA|nr:hypothetical protein PHYPA_008257 [Physcomitrium patens]